MSGSSYRVLRDAIDKVGAKAVAAKVGVSPSLIYKWCQNSKDSASYKSPSGANNPLDRLLKIYQVTEDPTVIQWLCEQADGYFVPNPSAEALSHDANVIKNINNFIKEFSEALEVISASYAFDKKITPKEAKNIRKEWEDLKRIGEGFVQACEKGKFDR